MHLYCTLHTADPLVRCKLRAQAHPWAPQLRQRWGLGIVLARAGVIAVTRHSRKCMAELTSSIWSFLSFYNRSGQWNCIGSSLIWVSRAVDVRTKFSGWSESMINDVCIILAQQKGAVTYLMGFAITIASATTVYNLSISISNLILFLAFCWSQYLWSLLSSWWRK